jgi:hypothetical protein
VKPKIPLPPEAIQASGLANTAGLAPAIAAASGNLRRVAFRMRTVDAVTTELVRIRNGRFQKCNY